MSTATTREPTHTSAKVVYRNLALPVHVFDYIKDFQRVYEGRTGERLSITQSVSAIVLGHQHHNEERGLREQTKKIPSILRSN